MSDRIWLICPDCGDLARYSPTLRGTRITCACGGQKVELPWAQGLLPSQVHRRVYIEEERGYIGSARVTHPTQEDSMSEEATKTYNPTARRAGYLRWKSRQDGKTLTDEERQELADYEASVKGADAEAIAQLRGMSKTDVKNTTKDELLALAQRAKLDVSEESSKKDIEAAIAAM